MNGDGITESRCAPEGHRVQGEPLVIKDEQALRLQGITQPLAITAFSESHKCPQKGVIYITPQCMPFPHQKVIYQVQ